MNRNIDNHCGCIPFTQGKYSSLLESGGDKLARVKVPGKGKDSPVERVGVLVGNFGKNSKILLRSYFVGVA